MRVAVPGRHLGQTVRKGVLRTWDKRRPCAPRPEFPFHLPAASLPRVSTLVLPAQGTQAGLLPEALRPDFLPITTHTENDSLGPGTLWTRTREQRYQPHKHPEDGATPDSSCPGLNRPRPCLRTSPARPSALHPDVHGICRHRSLSSAQVPAAARTCQRSKVAGRSGFGVVHL